MSLTPTGEDTWTIELNRGTSGDPRLEAEMIAVFHECYDLWCKRHKKYGRGNISKFGELGCLIRASDKFERLISLLFHKQGAEASDETAEDSWLDMANYALMALVCRRGKWDQGEPD